MTPQTSFLCQPIGIFHSAARYPYDVPRQASVAHENTGCIQLLPEFVGGLADLEGFSHIWVLYWFHRNHGWHARVQPPRHVSRKVGVFASRSPYRPNPIGMSVVELRSITQGEVWIARHDLLDGTPILDLKPYLPFADSFPNATPGWTVEEDSPEYTVVFSPKASRQLAWLEEHGVSCLRQFALTQLGYQPENPTRHRLVHLPPDGALALAYRTWRLPFAVNGQEVLIQDIRSGYLPSELASPEDKYHDKALHREFCAWKP